jgi:hypothetical protein
MFAKIIHFVSDQSYVPLEALEEASLPRSLMVA